MEKNQNILRGSIFKGIAVIISIIGFFTALACFVSAAETPLTDSEMVILKPHKVGPTQTMVYSKDNENGSIETILRTNPGFIKEVKYYQQFQRDNFERGLRANFPMLKESDIKKWVAGYKPKPVYMVLNGGLVNSVSFATSKPFGIVDVNADGKTSYSLKSAPIVTLSADTMNELVTRDSWGYQTVCHEIGHVIMYPTHGSFAYPRGISENIIETLKGEGHWDDKVTSPEFGLLEGWAEFNGAYFSGSKLYDCTYGTKKGEKYKSSDEMLRTEGVAAKILYDICTDKRINSDSDAEYKNIIATMTKHKPKTLNSFLTSYIQDNPSKKEIVEKIVDADTHGVVKINYNFGIKDWLADKWKSTKNVWNVFTAKASEWYKKLVSKFKKGDKKSAAATVIAPGASSTPERPDHPEQDSAINALTAPADSNIDSTDLIKLRERQKVLYERYQKAIAAEDAEASDAILIELRTVNEKYESIKKILTNESQN